MTGKVESHGNWLCSEHGDGWAIVRLQKHEPLIAPEDRSKLRDPTTFLSECSVDGRRILLIFAEHPKLESRDWRSLEESARRQLGDSIVLVVMSSSIGYLRIDDSLCETAEDLAPAYLAAAVTKARSEWDETRTIHIETDRRRIEVVPEWNGKEWMATITADQPK